jgi:hypothetical protein
MLLEINSRWEKAPVSFACNISSRAFYLAMIRNKYSQKMSPGDAKQVERMHHEAHSIPGMAFSLDCTFMATLS